jgi:hypothetical protein
MTGVVEEVEVQLEALVQQIALEIGLVLLEVYMVVLVAVNGITEALYLLEHSQALVVQ